MNEITFDLSPWEAWVVDNQGGSITADPWFQSENENTCAWCDYFDACHFDEKTDGWRYKSRLSAPEFWSRVACKKTEGGETPCP